MHPPTEDRAFWPLSVNDRPYVANSLTSVALNVAFRTAMSGHARELPERMAERLRWEATLPAVACDAGENLLAETLAED